MSEIDKKIEEKLKESQPPKKETSPPPIISAPTLSIEKCREHIKKIDEFLFEKAIDPSTGKVTSKFEGQSGFNPFLYRTQVLFKLETDLQLIEDKIITDTAEINNILASIMAIPTNVVPDAKALSKVSLIARDRRTMKKSEGGTL